MSYKNYILSKVASNALPNKPELYFKYSTKCTQVAWHRVERPGLEFKGPQLMVIHWMSCASSARFRDGKSP